MSSSSFSLKTRYWCPQCYRIHLPQQGAICESCNLSMLSVELIVNRYVFYPKNHLGKSVLKVWDLRMGRWAAIKFPQRKKEYQSGPQSSSTFSRIDREIFIQAQLEHPAIVSAYDVVEDPDYGKGLVMSLVEGLSLYQLVSKHGPIRVRAAVEIIRDITNAVQYMHNKGIIHRDLTPGNIVLEGKKPVLIDFGLAKFLSDSSSRDSGYLKARNVQGKDLTVTKEGEILGTPLFMSPEQVEGSASRVDQRSDIYGLGATLYYITTGQPPFRGKDVLSVVSQVLHKDPVPPSQVNPKIDKPLEAIIQKAMHKERGKRFQSAEEFYNALQAWLDGEDLPPEVYRMPLSARLAKRLGRWRRLILVGLLVLSLLFAAASYGYTYYIRSQYAALGIPVNQVQMAKFMEEAENRWAADMIENLAKENNSLLAFGLLQWLQKKWADKDSFQKLYHSRLKGKESEWAAEAERERKWQFGKFLVRMGQELSEQQLEVRLFLYEKALDLFKEAYTEERFDQLLQEVEQILELVAPYEAKASQKVLSFYWRLQKSLSLKFPRHQRPLEVKKLLKRLQKKIHILKEKLE